MPRNLIFVRHGESEGNHAIRMKRDRGIDLYTPEFRKRHGSKWRLTDKGIFQAKAAGKWIKENIGTSFFRNYTSSYLRALETAFYLALADAQWLIHPYLHERNWGLIENMPWEEADEKFKMDFDQRDMERFFWRPPRGESMDFLRFRVDRGVFDTLHRECAEQDVVLACHGEVMFMADACIKRMNPYDCNILLCSKEDIDKIHNGQVVHYSRINPRTQEMEPYLNWKRSACPWDLSLSHNTWEKIDRPIFSNDDLLRIVEKTPRIINNPA
jgi:NAD+ kinase